MRQSGAASAQLASITNRFADRRNICRLINVSPERERERGFAARAGRSLLQEEMRQGQQNGHIIQAPMMAVIDDPFGRQLPAHGDEESFPNDPAHIKRLPPSVDLVRERCLESNSSARLPVGVPFCDRSHLLVGVVLRCVALRAEVMQAHHLASL